MHSQIIQQYEKEEMGMEKQEMVDEVWMKTHVKEQIEWGSWL